MQALKDGPSVTTERFASPLNFNPNTTCYFSMCAEDALFGANFDAYSVKWTSASQVNPEYEAVAMEKAMRWAILSAEEAAKPVLTTLYYHGGMTKAAPMQGGYHTRRCKRLLQLTEAISNSTPQDNGLMNKISGAPQSGMSIS